MAITGDVKYMRLDSGESIFFERELEHVKARSYDVKHTTLKARMLIPVSSEADSAANAITYEQYDSVGIAKIISNYADDLPAADVTGKEFSVIVKSLGASYSYSIQEIRAAAFAGKPLNQRKADAAMRAIARAEENIAASGDTANNLGGLLNNSNITIAVATTKAAGGVTWAVATPQEIVNDLNVLVSTIRSATNGDEGSGLTVLLPTAHHTLISTRKYEDTNITIKEWILQNSPFIMEIDEWYKCNTAGAASATRIMAYVKSPDYVTLEIPQDVETFEPQLNNLAYKVPVHERIAGVIHYYPISSCYMDAT